MPSCAIEIPLFPIYPANIVLAHKTIPTILQIINDLDNKLVCRLVQINQNLRAQQVTKNIKGDKIEQFLLLGELRMAPVYQYATGESSLS